MQRQRPKMAYVHPEYNPRMMSGRKQPKDQEEFDSGLSSSHTPYSGKRSMTTTRVKNRQPSERDTLKNENTSVEEYPISTPACYIYGISGWIQVLFTIVLVILVGAQASTALTVKVLLILILVHNFITAFTLGMHQKIESKCAKSIETEHKGLDLMRHVRNDRRSTLLFLSMLVSCIAAIDITYISRITQSMDTRADSFRQSGVNTYTHRAIDVLSMLVFALAIPTALLIFTEIRFKIQELMRDDKDSDTIQGSDDDKVEVYSPRQ